MEMDEPRTGRRHGVHGASRRDDGGPLRGGLAGDGPERGGALRGLRSLSRGARGLRRLRQDLGGLDASRAARVRARLGASMHGIAGSGSWPRAVLLAAFGAAVGFGVAEVRLARAIDAREARSAQGDRRGPRRGQGAPSPRGRQAVLAQVEARIRQSEARQAGPPDAAPRRPRRPHREPEALRPRPDERRPLLSRRQDRPEHGPDDASSWGTCSRPRRRDEASAGTPRWPSRGRCARPRARSGPRMRSTRAGDVETMEALLDQVVATCEPAERRALLRRHRSEPRLPSAWLRRRVRGASARPARGPGRNRSFTGGPDERPPPPPRNSRNGGAPPGSPWSQDPRGPRAAAPGHRGEGRGPVQREAERQRAEAERALSCGHAAGPAPTVGPRPAAASPSTGTSVSSRGPREPRRLRPGASG